MSAHPPRAWARPVRSVALGYALAAGLAGCASRRSPAQVDWSAGEVISYRLVTQEDFQASGSGSVWGNVAHGAEICTNILPTGDHAEAGAFRAVMKPECSFWNKVVGPLGFFGRIAALFSPVPVMVPVKQPDWYILQHEQVHFAIMEVAARQLSKQVGKLSPERRSELTADACQLTLSHARDRHAEFDSETSGTYQPRSLAKWVGVLEAQMQSLCGTEPHCRVRQG